MRREMIKAAAQRFTAKQNPTSTVSSIPSPTPPFPESPPNIPAFTDETLQELVHTETSRTSGYEDAFISLTATEKALCGII